MVGIPDSINGIAIRAVHLAAEELIGHRIDDNRLLLHSVLGQGSFGVVFLAYGQGDNRTKSRQRFAVKCLYKASGDNHRRMITREVEFHQRASGHMGIAVLHKVIEEPEWIYLVLEYYPEGDLFHKIVKTDTFYGKDALVKDVFIQLLDAVEHCHRLSIYHRDLKPENVLCTCSGKRMVLTDFGLATSEKWSVEFGCGSGFYMSPELYGADRQPYSPARADIWSLGVILVNLVTGRNPWRRAMPGDGVFDLFLKDRNALCAVLPISPALNDILRRVFSIRPECRPTIPQFREAILKIHRFTKTPAEALKAFQPAVGAERAARKKHDSDRRHRAVAHGAVTDAIVQPCLPNREALPPHDRSILFNKPSQKSTVNGLPAKNGGEEGRQRVLRRRGPITGRVTDPTVVRDRTRASLESFPIRPSSHPSSASATGACPSTSSSPTSEADIKFPPTPVVPPNDPARVVRHDANSIAASPLSTPHALPPNESLPSPKDVMRQVMTSNSDQHHGTATISDTPSSRESFRQKIRGWLHKSILAHSQYRV